MASSRGTSAKMVSSMSTPRRISRKVLQSWELIGVPVEMIVRHFERRLFELCTSMAMFGEGLLLTLSPQSIRSSAFQHLPDRPDIFMLLFLTVGILRIVALGLNGHWMPYGAYTRAFGAGVGAFMWAQLAAALWVFGTKDGNVLPPGLPVFVALAQFEVISIYRALIGVKRWQANGKAD